MFIFTVKSSNISLLLISIFIGRKKIIAFLEEMETFHVLDFKFVFVATNPTSMIRGEKSTEFM